MVVFIYFPEAGVEQFKEIFPFGMSSLAEAERNFAKPL